MGPQINGLKIEVLKSLVNPFWANVSTQYVNRNRRNKYYSIEPTNKKHRTIIENIEIIWIIIDLEDEQNIRLECQQSDI
jgi:hypothetical protein